MFLRNTDKALGMVVRLHELKVVILKTALANTNKLNFYVLCLENKIPFTNVRNLFIY